MHYSKCQTCRLVVLFMLLSWCECRESERHELLPDDYSVEDFAFPLRRISVKVPKCCSEDEVYVNETSVCVQLQENQWMNESSELLTFYDATDRRERVHNVTVEMRADRLPGCEQQYFSLDPHTYDDDEYFFLTDGRLFVPGHRNPAFDGVYEEVLYCVEYKVTERTRLVVHVCFPHEEPVVLDHRHVKSLLSIATLCSQVCLLLTILACVLLPDMRNLHGMILLSHCTSLFVLYFCLTVKYLAASLLSPTCCVILVIVIHFSSLAAFSWLTVMCFDMWWKFRKQRPSHDNSQKVFQFSIYSTFAWGCPLLWMTMALILEYTPGIPKHILKPNYSGTHCRSEGLIEALVFMFCPIGTLNLVNIVLFAMTAYNIWRVHSDTKKEWKNSDSGRHTSRNSPRKQTKRRLAIYVKLFLIMGGCWIMEVVSWIGFTIYKIPHVYWIATDVINGLQGVFIAVVALGKVERMRRLKLHFLSFFLGRRHSQRLSTTTTTKRSTAELSSFSRSSSPAKTTLTSLSRSKMPSTL